MTINENGKSYIFIINDAVITSYLKVVKKDAETGNIIPVSGIGFKIWSCDKSAYVVQTVKYPSEMTMDTFYTDETGTMMLPEKLVYGNYELHEVESAAGYVLDETAVPFVVDGTTDTVIVEKLNTPQKGKISVEKTGDIFTNVEILASAISKDDEGNIIESGQTKYSPVFEEKNLSGAVFNVIAVEDIVTTDGTVRANKGDIVAELVTDENGYAETDLLYLGKYEVKEVTAPYGHVADTEPHYAELSYAGQTVAVRDTVNTSFFNEYQNVEISLEKVMEESEKFEIYGKDAYINVRFGLFADEEITAENGTTIPKDGFIAEVSLDENMTAKFSEKLPFGKYYVQEIATDEKYILNGEKYLVNFEYQGQEVTTVYIDCGTFDNKIKYGKVSGIKVNEADEPIENAMFGLFDEACEEFTEETAIETVISDEKGYFEFNNIPFGKYTVHEIKSAEGYILSDENHFVNITEDGDVIEIKAVNDKIKGNVTVTKIDKDYPENKLSGAEFTVYTDENCEAEISKLSETEKGIYTLCDLEYGKYFLKETVAPDGFILDKNVYPFSIENDGETVEVSNTKTGKGFINDAMCGKIKIVKTSSDGKLDGFQFRVTGVNYDQTFETDKNGEIIIENLRIGEYLISEVANHASASYVLPSDKTAVVKVDATTIVEMHNEKRDTPGTGDNFNPTLWVLIAASCVIGIAATGLVGYMAIKRKDK